MATLSLKPATEEQIAATRGGRGHGEYDSTLAAYLEAGERGMEVEFEGVKANSIKASLKAAIKRAVEAKTIEENQVEVRGRDEQVFLVRNDLS